MLTNLFFPVPSGSATQVRGLAAQLSQSGHRVIVITAHVDPNAPAHEHMEGFEVFRIPAVKLPKMSIALNFPWLNWTLWPRNLDRVADILKDQGIEVLHIHNHMFDMAFVGLLMRRRLGIPTMLTLHTVIKHSNGIFNLLLYPADRLLLKHVVVKHVDKVICPDVNMQRYLKDVFGREDGELLPYGIEIPDHPGQEIEGDIVEKFGLRGRRIILSLGHVHALRNRLDLIAAMPRIREEVPEVLLLIVGAVADKRPVELAAKLRLDDAVLFAGAQPHAHVSVYHKLAEIEAMWIDQASGGLNPLGVACMEGMLAGKPVVTVSNIDTFGHNVMENGREVVIIDAHNPTKLAATIVDLFRDSEKRARIGQAAKKLAKQRFRWSVIVERTVAIYQEVAEAKKP